ncbi:MAG: hypothetical protein HKL99_13610 [Burkholderiales bacterium]|nr:hypothetical protein [Burkholderiales bacterium]
MAKPNYSYEKRQKELAKQRKKQEKLQRKQHKPDGSPHAPEGQDAESSSGAAAGNGSISGPSDSGPSA